MLWWLFPRGDGLDDAEEGDESLPLPPKKEEEASRAEASIISSGGYCMVRVRVRVRVRAEASRAEASIISSGGH